MKHQPVESRRGSYEGRRLVIVATGPSYDDVPREFYDDEVVFALNFAITEFLEHPDCWWICHDLWTCFPRYHMPRRLKDYRWRLVTRRCYLPGSENEIPWQEKGGGRNKRRFPWRARPPKGSEVLWYSEFPDLDGFVRNGNTVLELALEVATCWGFTEVAIVGADMQKVEGRAYGAPWNSWKPCKIRREKFKEMRESLLANRGRWSAPRVYNLSPYWHSPFIDTTHEELPRRWGAE